MRFAPVSAVPLLILVPGMAFAQPAALPAPQLPPAALPPAPAAPQLPPAASPPTAAPTTANPVGANGAPVLGAGGTTAPSATAQDGGQVFGAVGNGVPGAITQDGMPVAPAAPVVAQDPTADWAMRDRDLGEVPNMEGSVGLLHMRHAQLGMPGQFRMQFMTEFFSGGWLCSPEFPCRNPAGGDPLTTDSHDHVGGQIGLGMTFTKWLEVSLSTSAYASSNTANRPALIQVLGDTTLGAKVWAARSTSRC
jgi:hypothetical protein